VWNPLNKHNTYVFDAVKNAVLACCFLIPQCQPSRLFPKFRKFASHVICQNRTITNHIYHDQTLLSVIMILFHLLRHSMLSLCSYFLRNSSRISTFNTSVEWHWIPNHCHCLVWVILSFHSSIRLNKSGSQGMDYRSKFPLHGIILCSRTGHTHTTCNQTETVVELNPIVFYNRTHVYLLEPYRTVVELNLMCSRTGHTILLATRQKWL